MGTEKRERQKANRQQRQIEEAREQRNSSIKRNTLRWVIVAVSAVALVVVIAWLGGAFEGDDEDDSLAVVDSTIPAATTAPGETTPATSTPDASSPETSSPGTTEPVVPTECPPVDGADEQRQEFDAYPPMCIDEDTTYTAVMVTNHGELTIELDQERAPLTVNNFVTLARYRYFDDTECHRAIPEFVVQCGDPTATGTGGPGYQFADELPDEGEYEIGSVAMANSGPDTNGSQFFLITGPNGAALPPQYSLFGMVTDGLDDTLPALDALGNPESNGVPPLEEIRIESITITEN